MIIWDIHGLIGMIIENGKSFPGSSTFFSEKRLEKPSKTDVFSPELWDKPKACQLQRSSSDQGGDFSGTSFRLRNEDTQKGYKVAG